MRSVRQALIVALAGAEVGPRVCDNPSLQQAFNQFHVNVHRVEPGAIGPAAPGLHNARGAELVVRGCSFVPPR